MRKEREGKGHVPLIVVDHIISSIHSQLYDPCSAIELPIKHGIRLPIPTITTPATKGSVPGLMEARVCPPRITAVTEKPSLKDIRISRNSSG
jgi:hypothetical protein